MDGIEFVNAINNNPSQVLEALRTGQLDAKARHEDVPILSIALKADQLDVARELINRGADVNAYAGRRAAERGMAPIHFAKSQQAVELLANAKANINAPYKDVDHAWGMRGETALHTAALSKDFKSLELADALLRAGADSSIPFGKEWKYDDRISVVAQDKRIVRGDVTVNERLAALRAEKSRFEQELDALLPNDVPELATPAKSAGIEKVYQGRLLAHGRAPYPSLPGEMSYFVDLEDANGEARSIWGPALAEALQVGGASVGDQVALHVAADGQNVRIERSGLAAESENTIAPATLPAADVVVKEQEKASEHDELTAESSVNAILPVAAKAKPIIVEVHDAMAAVRKGADGQQKDAGQGADAPAPVDGPTKLLNGRFVRDEKGDYRRIGETRVALADEGERIRFVDKQMDAFEAGVELAKSKGWEAIQVTGTEKFRAEAWFHARMEGLEVIGYEPVARDQERLEAAQSRAGKKVEAPSESVLQSKREAEDFVLGQGSGAQQANVEQGRYAGKVLHQTEHHFVQDLGRGVAVVHEKGRFPEKSLQEALQGSHNLRVQYKAGKAELGAGMDRGQSQGHSR